MTDQGPTTVNGPLHAPEAALDDRLIRATYATADEAQAARDRLIQSGIAADRINVISDAGDSSSVQAALEPKDQGLVARVRDALLPDEGSNAIRKAAANHEAILELRPAKEEVEPAVKIIEATNPTRFNAELERWRNKA